MEHTNILLNMPSDCLAKFNPNILAVWLKDKNSEEKSRGRAIHAYCQMFNHQMTPEDLQSLAETGKPAQ